MFSHLFFFNLFNRSRSIQVFLFLWPFRQFLFITTPAASLRFKIVAMELPLLMLLPPSQQLDCWILPQPWRVCLELALPFRFAKGLFILAVFTGQACSLCYTVVAFLFVFTNFGTSLISFGRIYPFLLLFPLSTSSRSTHVSCEGHFLVQLLIHFAKFGIFLFVFLCSLTFHLYFSLLL